MNSLYQIEKLDDSNYDAWKVQMKSILIHLELWDIVCGKRIKPEQAGVAATAWITSDEKALATIILSVKPTQLNYINKCKSALEAWLRLEAIHQPQGPTRKVTLFRQILHLKMKGDEVTQYLSEFMETNEKLSAIGINFPEEVLVIILLSQLPPSYENFVIAMESRDVLPSLSALRIKLIEEVSRRAQKNEEYSNSETSQAFLAKSNYKKNNLHNNNFKNNNNNGNKNNGNKSFIKNTVSNGNCFVCGKKGHFAAKCRLNKLNNTNERNSSFSVFAAANTQNLNKTVWCIDSGATTHLCCDRSLFVELYEHDERIELVGESTIEAKGKGEVHIKCEETDYLIKLHDVLYVPSIQTNFISVAKAVNNNNTVNFNNNSAIIKNKLGEIILEAKKVNNLYILEQNKNKCFQITENLENITKWHNRYGHVNFDCLKNIVNKKLVHGLDLKLKVLPENIDCVTCIKSKICTKSFPQKTENRSNDVLQLIHSDVCGPINTKSNGGARYFITFIDDKSRFIHVYFLKSKGEAFEAFKNYKNMVENETDKKIKMIRSDNGTEYVNNDFSNYLMKHGIKRQLSVPYSPQQNGVAERANRTIVEMARCMLQYAGLGESLWAEAVNTAVYLRNRAFTKSLLDVTPYEAWYNKKPSVKHFKIFGSPAIALNKKHSKKFQAKGNEYIMVGYSETSKAYRLFDPITHNVIVSRDVVFIENAKRNFEFEQLTDYTFLDQYQTTKNKEENCEEIDLSERGGENTNDENNADEQERENSEQLNPVSDVENIDENEQVSPVSPAENIVKIGRPKLIRTGKPGRPRKERNMLNIINNDVEIPQNIQQAISGSHSDKWIESMKREYDALIKNNTWSLVDLPNGEKPIGCKWVYTVKRDKKGNIDRFKSRLVGKGCSQKYGVNYTETFSPVIRYETIRMLLALAAEYKLYLHQIDVSTAYLNGDLHEDVYMVQPEGFVDEENPNKVLKLKKSLYGLKQAGREWNAKLDTVLNNIGFVKCESEPCLYKKHIDERINLIAVYVDDLLIACSDEKDLYETKTKIADNFEIVDKGVVHHFVGMEIDRDGATGAIEIGNEQYITKLLKEYNLETCKAVSTPLDAGFQIACQEDSCRKVNPTKYQALIGSLMFLAVTTRPDILHSVCKLAQRNNDPHSEHEAGAKHVLRYLSKTIKYKLHYRHTGKPIEGYVDADWASDATDRKSYTGYAFFLGGSIFSWESKKQQSVALSSTEAEYVALSTAAKEATYLKGILNELNFGDNIPVMLYSDNLSAQHLVRNPVYHSRSKHIDVKYHHIREILKNKLINITYVATGEMIADLLTKNLPKLKHLKFIKLMGLY